MDRDNQVTINYEKITGEFIFKNGQESLLILALLSRHYSIRREFVFSIRYLYTKLGIPLNKKDKKDRVLRCINNMFNVNLDANTCIDDLLTIPYTVNEGQYLAVKDQEVDNILNCNEKRVDKYTLFNTYVAIKRYTNFYTNTSYPSISTLMFVTNVGSNNTMLRYVRILESMGMIICNKSDKYQITDSGIKRPNNQYLIPNSNNIKSIGN